jgi:hypothetical protein
MSLNRKIKHALDVSPTMPGAAEPTLTAGRHRFVGPAAARILGAAVNDLRRLLDEAEAEAKKLQPRDREKSR